MKRIPIQSFPRSTLKRYFSTPCKAYLEATHAAPSSTSAATQDILNRGRQYLLPVYVRPDFVLSHGKGAWVWDVDGRKFLDFSAGIAVNALGHADEGVLKASLYSIDLSRLFYFAGSNAGNAILYQLKEISSPSIIRFVPTLRNFFSPLHAAWENVIQNKTYS
jgi:hypothetical protein